MVLPRSTTDLYSRSVYAYIVCSIVRLFTKSQILTAVRFDLILHPIPREQRKPHHVMFDNLLASQNKANKSIIMVITK